MPNVAYQGVRGAYAESAILSFFGPDADTVACQSLEGVFDAVETNQADLGIIAVENALVGSWPRAYELLLERDLRIQAEVIIRIRHTLMASPDVKLADLKRVRSSQHALSQCEQFIVRHGLVPIPAFDMASSAQGLAENPETDLGVIASPLAAEVYGLQVLEDEIEDAPFNFTRFFILGDQDPPRTQRSKTSLIFGVRHAPHQPGSLYACLGEFAERNINLTKIESRPRRNRPWDYFFYLDFEGHWQDPAAEAALLGLLQRASFVKMLGCYPLATTPHPHKEDDGFPQSGIHESTDV
jgi:prephenate dehydratase